MSTKTFNGCISLSEVKNDSEEVIQYKIETAEGNIKSISNSDVFGIVDGKHSSMKRKAVTVTERSEKGIITIQQECFWTNDDDLEYKIYTLNKE